MCPYIVEVLVGLINVFLNISMHILYLGEKNSSFFKYVFLLICSRIFTHFYISFFLKWNISILRKVNKHLYANEARKCTLTHFDDQTPISSFMTSKFFSLEIIRKSITDTAFCFIIWIQVLIRTVSTNSVLGW